MARRFARVRGLSNVLCAVDFSADSRAALRSAAAIASVPGGALTVVYVSDPMLLAAAAAGYDQQALEEDTSHELAAFIRSALPARGAAGLKVSTEIRIGKPVRTIVTRARQGRFDLIVLGTRGLNGARRLLLGSTTAGVLRRSGVPVLTIPGAIGRRPRGAQWPPRRLVGAIELGTHAAADAAAYADVARLVGVPLTLVHVVKVPPTPGWYGPERKRPVDRTGAVHRTLQRLLDQHAEVVDEVVVLSGDPPTGIEAAASARQGATILMMLRSRPGLFGSRAGAVAYEVLCRGVAPVLAIPGR